MKLCRHRGIDFDIVQDAGAKSFGGDGDAVGRGGDRGDNEVALWVAGGGEALARYGVEDDDGGTGDCGPLRIGDAA